MKFFFRETDVHIFFITQFMHFVLEWHLDLGKRGVYAVCFADVRWLPEAGVMCPFISI